MMRARLLGLPLLALIACGNGPGDPGAPGPVLDLRECAAGVWLEQDRDCQCVAEPFYTAECDQPDCVESDMLVLGQDGAALEFTFRRSPAAGHFSAVLGETRVELSAHSWSVEGDDTIVRLFPGDPPRRSEWRAECRSEEMLLDGVLLRHRAPESMRVAVLAAWDAGGWTVVPYEP